MRFGQGLTPRPGVPGLWARARKAIFDVDEPLHDQSEGTMTSGGIVDSLRKDASKPCELIDPLTRSGFDRARETSPPLLVAVDGSRASGAALKIAAALAARDGGRIEALLVERPLPAPVSGVCIDAASVRDEYLPEDSPLGRVRRQLCAILGADGWNLHVEFGHVGATVANCADLYGARLIVMGLARHNAVGRLLHLETAPDVLHHARVPILAVAAAARKLPHTAVVGIDFSPASLAAAREVRELLAAPGSLHLVHVRAPIDGAAPDGEGRHSIYEAGAAGLLDDLATELSDDGVTVRSHIEAGNVADTLLRVAARVKAGVLACGTHSSSVIERLILGSVPREILRRAECSVLVAPYGGPVTSRETGT